MRTMTRVVHARHAPHAGTNERASLSQAIGPWSGRVLAMNPAVRHALRGAALTFGMDAAVRYESDAVIVIEAGKISDFGAATDVMERLAPGTTVRDVGTGTLILPGFIDTHVHYPQTQIMGSHGAQLLDWLNRYTFVA